MSYYKENYSNSDNTKIQNELVYVRDHIVHFFNRSIFPLCKKEGFYIIWTDMSYFTAEIVRVFDKGHIAIHPVVSKIGFGAALKGLEDLKYEKEIVFIRQWNWFFDYNKTYLCYGILLKNNNIEK